MNGRPNDPNDDYDDSEDRDFNPDSPTENIPMDIIDNPMNPQFTYRNWEDYICVNQPVGASILRDKGVLDYSGAIVFKDGKNIELQGPNKEGFFQAAPYYEASRLQLDLKISAQKPNNELDPVRWEERMSITIETGDILTVDVVSDAIGISLNKNGQEFLDPQEINTISNMYNDFYVVITLKSYAECTIIPPKEDDYEGGNGGGNDDQINDSEGLSLYVILGGLVAFVILSFIISTTGDSDGS